MSFQTFVIIFSIEFLGVTHVDRLLANKSMVAPPCQVENKKMTNRATLLRNRKEINKAKTVDLRIQAQKQVIF